MLNFLEGSSGLEVMTKKQLAYKMCPKALGLVGPPKSPKMFYVGTTEAEASLSPSSSFQDAFPGL